MKNPILTLILVINLINAYTIKSSTESLEDEFLSKTTLRQFSCQLLKNNCTVEVQIPNNMNAIDFTANGTTYFSIIKLEQCDDKYISSFNCSTSNDLKKMFIIIKPMFAGNSKITIENKISNLKIEESVSITEPQSFIDNFYLNISAKIIAFLMVALFSASTEMIMMMWKWTLIGIAVQWFLLPLVSLKYFTQKS